MKTDVSPRINGTQRAADYSHSAPSITHLYTRRLTPIVCISGLWHQPGQWKQAAALLPERGFYPVEVQGHDGSADRRLEVLDRISLSAYAADLESKILQIKSEIRAPIVLGHSAGAYLAQMIIPRLRSSVQGAILLASSPPKARGVGRIPLQRRFLRPPYLWAMATGRAYRLDPREAAFISGRAPIRLGPESGRATREILLKKFAVEPLPCPTLVIAAANDQFHPIDLERDIAAYHTAVFRVCEGDHMFHADPESQIELFREVEQWCRDRLL